MTGLLGKSRVPKDDARIEAYGTVDELNAVLGLVTGARARLRARTRWLAQASERAFRRRLGPGRPFAQRARFINAITAEHVARLETQIDALETELKPLTQFILPGGTLAAAHIHLARTVCRRAERLTVRLSHQSRRKCVRFAGHLPESAERPLVRTGPRGQPSCRSCRYALEGHVSVPSGSNLQASVASTLLRH